MKNPEADFASPQSAIRISKFFALCSLLLAVGSVARAAEPAKLARIGFLTNNSPTTCPQCDAAFRLGLRELGYIEGKNIMIEWRYAEGKPGRLQEMLNELIRSNVAVIVSPGPASTRIAKESNTTIPIVMATDPDPVANGFVDSLARPGGNVTGLSTLAPEISGKQLEILKEVVPRLARLAVFGTALERQRRKEVELAAAALEVKYQFIDIVAANDIEPAFQKAAKGRADGLLVVELNEQRQQVVDLAVKHRLPAIYTRPEYIDAGGLMYYGTDYLDLFRRAATYVDKILKGAKPGDLPIEPPKKFDLIINLKAAKQIGLTIPPNVLARADIRGKE
jgi:putative tryptophan/tyrosine transport system substrate-binding protein